jgi:hypothetical protein
MLTRRVVCGLVFLIILVSVPLFAIRRADTASSQNGFFDSCLTIPNPGTCPFVEAEGTASLNGTDATGNPVTVTIGLYNWGSYPCLNEKCTPKIDFSVLDVTLAGTDTVGIESLVVKGVLSNPGYITCGEGGGVGCINFPEPDGSDVQEPTPIAGADNTNTRWDFGGLPPSNPPAPAVPFDQLVCFSDGHTNICTGSPLGEAVLVVSNSVAQNHLATSSSNYLVTLTDGTKLGTLAIPASPTKQAATTNNTQATATVITKPTFKDYTDTSQAYPGINADGSMNYPVGFALAPVPPPSSPSFPSCYPGNGATNSPDTRTFRTVWYTYTASSDGSITINTTGSRYDTLIYVFTGNASEPATVSCDDDSPSSGLPQSATTFNATKGTQYWIVVYETPTFQTLAPGSLTGYPLSVDGTLYFHFGFSTAPPTTTTTLASSPKTVVFGQTVEFTARVTSKRPGTPTGTVTFTESSTTLGTGPVGGGSQTASIFAVPLTEGANSITATYSGDSNFDSSSGSLDLTVGQAKTTSTIKSSQNPSNLGQSVTFTATIKPEYSGEATGTVTFKDGGTTLGVSPVNSNIATLATTALTAGTSSITAVYSGDSNFDGSTSAALKQTVK